MAKRNIVAEFIRYDLAHERKLRIYENKQGIRGSLLDTYDKVIESRTFKCGADDEGIALVKKAYGFTDENSYQV